MMRAASPRSEHRQVRRGQQNWRKGSQPGGSPSLPTALSPCCCRPPATPLTSPSLPMQGWGCLPRWSGCSQQQWWRTAARTLLVHPGLEHLGDNWHLAKLEPAQFFSSLLSVLTILFLNFILISLKIIFMYTNLAPSLLADMLIIWIPARSSQQPWSLRTLIEFLPAAIQLHLHLLRPQQLEQHLLNIPLHNLEEVGGDFALLKPQIKLSTIPLLKSCQEISGSVRLLSGMPFPNHLVMPGSGTQESTWML